MSDLANELKSFGGKLVCQTCGRERQLGNIGNKLAHGWPMCCGLTMRWITQRELDALSPQKGETPDGEAL